MSLNAIVSVSDPAKVEELGRELAGLGARVYATGGTKARLSAAGIEAYSVSELTGFPEILGGRVKMLHPGIHSGILVKRDDPAQMAQLAEHGMEEIHLVAVNLYPFAKTIAKEGVTLGEAVEQIDIGGPTMLRAAAKNFMHVIVLCDPSDYAPVMREWRERAEVGPETRQRLAAKAFRHVSEYDALIAGYLEGEERGVDRGKDDAQPQEITLKLSRAQALRYGENPHQKAALYRDNSGGGRVRWSVR